MKEDPESFNPYSTDTFSPADVLAQAQAGSVATAMLQDKAASVALPAVFFFFLCWLSWGL
jgi:hypothetical protein